MATYQQVQAAAGIGVLAAEPDGSAAAGAAVGLLARAVGGDACSLVVLDPVSGRHRQVVALDYPDDVARLLAVGFADTPWFGMVVGGPLPPSISTEPAQSFRRGWFYEHHLAPAGFRDGMSGALRRGRRYVGLVHVSSTGARRFDAGARRVLAAVLPALTEVVDPLGRLGRDLHPGFGRAALYAGGRPIELAPRELPLALRGERFRLVVADFLRCATGGLRMLWQLEAGWCRIRLDRAAGPGGGVLVQEQPGPVPFGLSARELDVQTRVAMGASNQAIAEDLTLSPRTVHSHVQHILRKTGARSRAEICAMAIRDGLVRPVPGLLCRRDARVLFEPDPPRRATCR